MSRSCAFAYQSATLRGCAGNGWLTPSRRGWQLSASVRKGPVTGVVERWEARRHLAVGLFVAASNVAIVTAVIWSLRGVVPDRSMGALYVLAVLPVAVVWGMRVAMAAIVMSVVAFDFFHLAPSLSLGLANSRDLVVAATTGITAFVASSLAARLRQRADETRELAREQAALRNVATCVARAPRSEEIFETVSREVGQLLGVDITLLIRYHTDGAGIVVGAWSRTGGPPAPALGTRFPLEGDGVHSRVFRTALPVRVDSSDLCVPDNAAKHEGFRSCAGAPISLDNKLWGAILVAYRHDEALPTDSETRLAAFTELVATAIANAETRAALVASRARIVATADAARRQIERNIHDAAQQRLVSAALKLRAARTAVPASFDEILEHLDAVADELTSALEELREIARGVHPAVLVEGGLSPALKSLTRRSTTPVRLDMQTTERFDEQTESAAYYVVAESLTNVAKHARASHVDIEAFTDDSKLVIRIYDDGCGGASLDSGSGLMGLHDRVEAVGGSLALHSPRGSGTMLIAALPIER
jgi:signal transduction histidine kinase